MLRDLKLCYIRLCFVVLRYGMVCKSRYVMQCNGMLRSATFRHVTLGYFTLCFVMPWNGMVEWYGMEWHGIAWYICNVM